ncbi:MAG: LysR family transcriptional regulator [Janthinobacterium lividum]
MDQIGELTAFVRTVECGSQAGAARLIGITPAMVGRYLRALEDRLGARLLNRSTATQSLTEVGTVFHGRAVAVLEELAAAEAAVTDRQAEPVGTLRISAPMVFGTRYLAAALARFGAAHPGLTIELTLNDRLVDLVEEGFDLALRIGQLADSTLVARRLAPCRLMVVAAPDYLTVHGVPERPEALSGHECLTYAYARDGRVVRFLGPEGRSVAVELRGRFAANNGDALLEATIAGAGLLVTPTFIAGDALRKGQVRQVLEERELPALALYAVFPSARHLAPKVRLCVDALASCFGESPAWDAGLSP